MFKFSIDILIYNFLKTLIKFTSANSVIMQITILDKLQIGIIWNRGSYSQLFLKADPYFDIVLENFPKL